MASEAVQPLRINKNSTPSSSPSKMPRPLSEIGSTSQRRNSPSYLAAARKTTGGSRESSPFDSSPFQKSPRLLWEDRERMLSPGRFDSENTPERELTPSHRRASIEKLARASRVKNSNIFAREQKDNYDPSSPPPFIERPLANRSLNSSLQGNPLVRYDSLRKENNPLNGPPSAFNSPALGGSPPKSPSHRRTESKTELPTWSFLKSPELESAAAAAPALVTTSPKREPASPTKSSLSANSRFDNSPGTFEPENDLFSDDEERAGTPKAGPRHAKSVTFETAPPEINEYEQQTPEPSSIASGSREGSFDSDDYEDQSFERGSSLDQDSFDDSLEDTTKTPVVLPEDWRHMSPDIARTDLVDEFDDVFEGSPAPSAQPGTPKQERPSFFRADSQTSDGSSRPLPPIPAIHSPGADRGRRGSGSLFAAAERASSLQRQLPMPPAAAAISKDDLLSMTKRGSMSLEDRLELMALRDSPATTPSTEKPPVGLGLGGSLGIIYTDPEARKRETQVQEREVDEGEEIADLADFAAPPRISRESILRKVKSSRYDDFEDDEYGDEPTPRSSPPRDYANLDPDVPIPSRETSTNFNEDDAEVFVKEEEEDESIDLDAIPTLPNAETERSPSRIDAYARESSVIHHKAQHEEEEEDDASRYSSPMSFAEKAEEKQEEPAFPPQDSRIGATWLNYRRTTSPTEEAQEESVLHHDIKRPMSDDEFATPLEEPSRRKSMGLPVLSHFLGTDDFAFGLKDYITPSPPISRPVSKEHAKPQESILNPPVLAPHTPTEAEPERAGSFEEHHTEQPAEQVEQDLERPGTPGSVVHHSADLEDEFPAEAELEHETELDFEPASEYEVQPGHAHEVPEVREAPATPTEEIPIIEAPVIPERKATIKTGGKLKARPSGTQADLQAMINARRAVSGEIPPSPALPDIYQEPSESLLSEESLVSASELSNDSQADSLVESNTKRRQSRKQLKLDLDIPTFESEEGLGLGLDKEFDRVIASQKVAYPFHLSAHHPPQIQQNSTAVPNISPVSFPLNSSGTENTVITPFYPQKSTQTNLFTRPQKGYLMRQNTKVVVASNRNFSNDKSPPMPPMSPTFETVADMHSARGTKSAGSSPRKPSGEKFLTTEPWNGKTRRKSTRQSTGRRQSNITGPAPPLPGQESALGVVDEYTTMDGDDADEETERGRLFVKVVGVKDLDLPMPRNDRLYFQLTLDNGLHCVTTPNLELGKSAPIGQEFELVVLNDLEFQLTLTSKLPPKPKAPQPPAPLPAAAPRSPTKTKQSAFSRLLSSPKKRAERERKEREEAETEERRRQEEFQRRQAAAIVKPTPWDRMREVVDEKTGSFARAYVSLKSHEAQCFGTQYTVDVPCFNEWALEKDASVVSSVRSKRSNAYGGAVGRGGEVKRPPYTIGKLELQLMYVPKPKGAEDDDMPKSMSSAIREMKAAMEVKESKWEGCLSQQGGDCPYWRRRFFRLSGTKLTAYHEHTHQPRATINLSKATKLIDDRTSLVADPVTGATSTSSGGKGRRKSAFAEEDEGYAFVEEGFRIRFANGETIDFYADNREQKDEWMKALAQSLGKPASEASKRNKWTDVVLAHQRAVEKAARKADDEGAKLDDRRESKRLSNSVGIPARQASKSAPTSPVKRSSMSVKSKASTAADTVEEGDEKADVPDRDAQRPLTPPMNPRRGHRERDAVKSMIF